MRRALVWALALGGLALAQSRFTQVDGPFISADTGYTGCNPHAVAVEDFNRDGRPDLIVSSFTKAPHVHYFQNQGQLHFRDVTAKSGLETFTADGSGAAVADFDHDGRLDLFLSALRGGASRLYKGRADGTFVDVTASSRLQVTGPGRSCAWSDVDGDGWVDLYVTSPEGPNFLFLNQRDGTFREVARTAGVDLPDRESLGCAFADVDGDGRDDLFVSNYHSQVSALFKNLGGGRFRDITVASGLQRKASAVGCAFADIFNRGVMDLYVSTDSWLSGANYSEAQLKEQGHTVEPNQLYRNDGHGRFSPVAMPAYKSLSHDISLEDLDQDGNIDIYLGVDAISGNEWATSKGGNPLWSGPDWRDVAASWGVKAVANCVCVPAVDLDGDGDLDLLLVNFYSNPILYRNNLNDGHWLEVRAAGSASNPDGIGAKVYLYSGPRLIASRQIQSGSGYGKCSPLLAHFGLGRQPAASYRVEVTFSNGKRSVQNGVKPGQRLLVRESPPVSCPPRAEQGACLRPGPTPVPAPPPVR